MRNAWRRVGAWMNRILGWASPTQELRLEYAVKTQFRGAKTQFDIQDWQRLAQVFVVCPDLEDFIQMKIHDLEYATNGLPIASAGDRARLVNQAQRDVLAMFADLPKTSAARVNEMLKAKRVPSMKGTDHVYP